MINVAINGFGRIGRCFLRALLTQQENQKNVNVVAINDLADVEQLAHLLKYDTSMGRLAAEVSVEPGKIVIDGKVIEVYQHRDPSELPWQALNVDVVVESTGVFTDANKARAHLQAGARKVLISAPATNEDITLVYGVNHQQYDDKQHQIISNASCTTNCLAPVLKAVNDTVGVESGFMTTIHAFTQDQNLQDSPHRDPRRARSAAYNLVPTSTGAAKAIGLVLPELDGKLEGSSVRAPVITGSLIECTLTTSRETSVAELNAILKEASESTMKGVLAYTDDPIVSSDCIGHPASSIFDSKLTKVINKKSIKLVSWYDNEWGFSNRLIDTIRYIG